MRQAFQVSSPGRLRDDWCFARVPRPAGEGAEWFKAHAWKACIRETVSRVRIPPPPPVSIINQQLTCYSVAYPQRHPQGRRVAVQAVRFRAGTLQATERL